MISEKFKDKREKNQQEREEFIELWVNYIKNHSDEEWSRQQNKIINSQLKTAREADKKLLK
jgi:hypothetical protein